MQLQHEYNIPLKPGFAFFFLCRVYLVASTIVYSWSRTYQNAPVLLLSFKTKPIFRNVTADGPQDIPQPLGHAKCVLRDRSVSAQ
jgi:hypothetical protein